MPTVVTPTILLETPFTHAMALDNALSLLVMPQLEILALLIATAPIPLMLLARTMSVSDLLKMQLASEL
jgi:hypothetical protein